MPVESSRAEQFGLIPDLLTSYIFVVDSDVRLLHVNAAAERLLGVTAGEGLHRRGGEALHCIHAVESPGGCGCAAECVDCPLRSAVKELISGKARVRKRVRLWLKRDDRITPFFGVVTAVRLGSPDGEFRALLVIDNVDDLMELREILPVCMGCGKIKAGDADADWMDAALYLHRSYEVPLSHGYCPSCLRAVHESGEFPGSTAAG